jgi:hypothetical protein
VLGPVRELSPPRRPAPRRPRKLQDGHCRAKDHQADILGIGGRRVLVSRQWSGQTLADHGHDQAASVRKTLAVGLGHTADISDDQAGKIDAGREGG